jgi:hypothetical protein
VAREVVARAEEGSRGGEQDRGRERTTRGVIPAGGGAATAAERQPGAGHCAGGRRSRIEQHVPEEEEERGEVRGGCLEISRISGTSR